MAGWTLEDIQITPPPDDDRDFRLTVVATAFEADYDSPNPSMADSVATVDVQVVPVADLPMLTAVSSVIVDEDGATNLGINADLVDTDGSESLGMLIGGIPIGATLSDETNSYTRIEILSFVSVTGWTLENIEVTPPPNQDAEFQLTVVATSYEADNESSNFPSAETTATVMVQVDALADVPNLSVTSPVTGVASQPVPVSIVTSLNDVDGSETLAVSISGVPALGTFNQGTNDGGGEWSFTPAELTGLTLNVLDENNFTLNVTAKAIESAPTSVDTTVALREASVSASIDVIFDDVVSDDLNHDGSVDAADAGIMFGNWGGSGIGDLNDDGIVDAADAADMFANWTGDSLPGARPYAPVSESSKVSALVRQRRYRSSVTDRVMTEATAGEWLEPEINEARLVKSIGGTALPRRRR